MPKMLQQNKIYNLDALEGLKQLDSESVDCVMTSPPYWSLRDYGVEGQLGLENTFEEYITKLCNIFDEVKRVLKKTGTCWVNIGDSYASSNSSIFDKDKYGGKNSIHSGRGIIKEGNYPQKSLCLIPFRFAIEMVNRGWLLRNDNVWYKRNSMPASVKDRFANTWEHVFFFTKSKKYYFDLDAVRKPLLPFSIVPNNAGYSNASAFNYRVREATKGTLSAKFGDKYKANKQELLEYGNKKTFNKTKYNNLTLEKAESLGSPISREVRYNSKFPGNHHSEMINRMVLRRSQCHSHDSTLTHPLGGNPGDFWDITPQHHPFAHFAVYPERLCEVPIKSGSPKDGLVLDPFMGSGTTGVVAKRLGRNYIGFELNPSYIEIAEKRIKPYLEQRKLVV